MDDLYSLDDDALSQIGGEIKALIFLFKWVATPPTSSSAVEYDKEFGGFFAKQVRVLLTYMGGWRADESW